MIKKIIIVVVVIVLTGVFHTYQMRSINEAVPHKHNISLPVGNERLVELTR